MKILKREDPFSTVGVINIRTEKNYADFVNSLNNVNLEIKKGDAVGVIGKNGAGKSTLLKIISRVTSPTKGKININGRVASLLEVGTGFHPELTGRENIYLNGAILGMRKKEIDRKFEEIVDFSGVKRYIDTPVKRYSSGMYVRLAFAVAAHLESEILIVDEVLAVGDAEFQKKCLGKMGEISKGEGRTILFVSHNMSAIQKMCNTSILMQNGTVIKIGDTESVISQYINQENKTSSIDLSKITERKGNQKLIITNAFFVQKDLKSNQLISLNETELHIVYKINNINIDYREIRIDIGINDLYGTRVGWFSTWNKNHNVDKNKNTLIFKIKNFNLSPGEYNCNLFLGYNDEVADFIQEVNPFTVVENDYFKTGKSIPQNQGVLLFNYEIIN